MFIKEYKIFDLDEGEIEIVIEATNNKNKECWYDIGYVFKDLLTLINLQKIKDKIYISEDIISRW